MEDKKTPVGQSDDIDLGRYMFLFSSKWLWIVLSLAFAIAIAYSYNRFSDKVYTVTSTLLIKDEKSAGSADMDKILPGGDIFGSRQNLENEIAILESYSLHYRVMEEMPEFQFVCVPLSRQGIPGQRLFGNSPFVVTPMAGGEQPYRKDVSVRVTQKGTFIISVNGDAPKEVRAGEMFNGGGFSFMLTPRLQGKDVYDPSGKNRYVFWFESPASLANDYRKKLTVAPVKKDASALFLSIDTYSPEQGSAYLNKLMELYILQGIELKNQAAEKTIVFIDTQVGLISDSLVIAENDMEHFRLNNRFVDLTIEGTLVLERLEKFENEKSVLELQMQYHEYLLDYLDSKEESGTIISPSVMGVSDPVIIGLVEGFSKLQQQKKQMAYSMNKDLPAVLALEQQVEEARAGLRENIASTISQLKISIKDVDNRIAAVERELNLLPGTQRRLVGIQRKFDLNNTVYTFLLEKRAEAGIAKASRVSDNRIIDMAVADNSTQIRPNVIKNYAIAIMLGLLVPMLIIVIIDLLRNKIIGKNDIERVTRIPIIGYIGHSDYDAAVPVVNKPSSTLAESFRSVRTSLSFFTGKTRCPVIVISSPVSGEGKSFVSANLAAITSMLGRKVLLVGLDLRKPRLQKMLGVGNGQGMSTYLSDNATYEEIIIPSGIENLWFAPAGPIPPNPAEILGSERLTEFFTRSREEFDFIFVDTPPVGIVTDAIILSSVANVTLFVIRQRYTTHRSLSLIDDLYHKGEIGNMALLMNDISISGPNALRYGYNLGYGNRYYEPGKNSRRRGRKGDGYYIND